MFALTNRVARPLLGHEVDFLVADLCQFFDGRRNTRRLIRAFEAYWATLQADQPGWPHPGVEQQFDVLLRQWLAFHRAILLGELVPVALRFLQDNPHSPLAPAFGHVLVDEYQDLNRADQVFIDQLARNGSVVIIGDPDQSIYRFRYANPGAMTDYALGHPGTHDETLGECRRCPQRVVAMAAALVNHNLALLRANLDVLNGMLERGVQRWNSMTSAVYRLIGALAQLSLPWCLTPGSPTPMENGLRGVSSALNDLNRQALPSFSANLGGLQAAPATAGSSIDYQKFARVVAVELGKQFG